MTKYGFIYWALALYTLCSCITDSDARTYGENIWLKDSDKSVSTVCKKAVNYFNRYISSTNETVIKDEILDAFFGKGLRTELISDDRFLYRMLQCFKFAQITQNVVPNHLFHYCYGYDGNNPESTAYSICIPSSCANHNQTLLNNWKTIASAGIDKTPITETRCVRSLSEKQWYQKIWPYFAMLFILGLIFIVAMATVYDCQRCKRTKHLSERLFLAFSARKNLRTIFVPSLNERRPITCMYGIRSLTMLWIIIGHSLVWVMPYIENPDDLRTDIGNHFHNLWITNFLLTVDIFLVLGGTVNAYGWFSKMERTEVKPGWSSYGYWLRFYRHRLVRLWPTHFYTLIGVLFLNSVNFYDYWPELDPSVQCKKYWWHNLLLINSFFNSRCMAWTWYISVEFMFYLVSPIFLLTLRRSKMYGILLSCAVIVLSSVLRGYAMIAYNLPATQLGWVKPTIFTKNFMQQFEQMYIKPYYRIGPYIIGLLLGYHLCTIRNTLPKKFGKYSYFGWAICVMFGSMALFGLYPILQGWQWPIYYVIYGAIHRVVYAVAVAWLIYACHSGLAGWINKFLSARAFYPSSSLTYTIYLNHIPVLLGMFVALPFPYYYTGKIPLILKALGSTVFTVILGLQASLLVELPGISIEKILLSRPVVSERSQNINELQAKTNNNQGKPALQPS